MLLHKGKNLLQTNYQIAKYSSQAIASRVLNKKNPTQQRRRALSITARNSKELLDKLNVKVRVKNSDPQLFARNYFMVCNHMSYFDIVILSSIQPAVFVTSVEMEKTFFLGDMAKIGGSFFVDRVNRRKMKAEVQALKDLLDNRFNVFIFPEGTSTNGSEILPFKKSLFRVPFQASSPILPICLKYRSIDGEPFSADNCDRICWYDDMTFAPHFLQLMSLKELVVEVEYLTPLDPTQFSSHGELSEQARQQIISAYQA